MDIKNNKFNITEITVYFLMSIHNINFMYYSCNDIFEFAMNELH